MSISDGIIQGARLDYEPSPQGIGFELFHSMKQNHSAIAQIDAATGEQDTYGRLLRRCVRVCGHLLLRGLGKGDTIALCTDNHLDSCVPILCGFFLGVRVAPLDPQLSRPDAAHLLAEVRPRVAFVSGGARPLVEGALRAVGHACELIVFGAGFDELLQEAVRGESEFEPLPIASLRQTGIILFSSGTTGLPKGVCLSHYALMMQMVITADYWNLGERFHLSNYTKERNSDFNTKVVGFTSYYWISALGVLNCATIVGATRLICGRFEPIRVLEALKRHQVEVVTCASFQARAFVGAMKESGIQLPHLRLLFSGGAPLQTGVMEELRMLLPAGAFITNAYGQTEISGAVTMYNLTKIDDVRAQYDKPQSCGRPIPNIFCKVIDTSSGSVLGPNEAGELCFKSKFVMNGYYDRNEAAEAMGDEWIRSGDVAYYDNDLCFFVVGRIKEMFKYKGWHIVPAMLERVLLQHEQISEAVIVGVAANDGNNEGLVPMAIVVLKRGQVLTCKEIEVYFNGLVSDAQKLRGGVRIVESIPKTAIGKVRRRDLAKEFL